MYKRASFELLRKRVVITKKNELSPKLTKNLLQSDYPDSECSILLAKTANNEKKAVYENNLVGDFFVFSNR